MLKVYGIKNCDTMKKAFTWLDAHGVSYEFHDYKAAGIDIARLKAELGLDRPMWQRVVIVLSSIPIALIVNIARITATGLLYAMFPQADADFRHHVHDMWGFVMMPLAMLLIFLEFKILSNLLIEDEDDDGPDDF